MAEEFYAPPEEFAELPSEFNEKTVTEFRGDSEVTDEIVSVTKKGVTSRIKKYATLGAVVLGGTVLTGSFFYSGNSTGKKILGTESSESSVEVTLNQENLSEDLSAQTTDKSAP